MESEMKCDNCKQRTESLYGLFNMMVCKECHARLITVYKNELSLIFY